MPFSTLDKNWSNLASYYNPVDNGKFNSPGNVTFTTKPEYPRLRYTGFDDGLIRGGVTNVGISVIRDTARIGKFLISPKGLLFVGKQFGLQRTNPQLESDFPTTTSILDSTKWYSPLNTLLQVPINALGGHFTRHGLIPRGSVGFYEGSSKGNGGYNYEQVAKRNNALTKEVKDVGKNANRLVDHFASIIKTSTGEVNLLKYGGGAATLYGLGRTNINTTNVRTTIDATGNIATDVTGKVITDPLKIVLNGFTPFSNTGINRQVRWNLFSLAKYNLYNSPLYSSWKNTDLVDKKLHVVSSDGKGNVGTSYDIETRIGVSTSNRTYKDIDNKTLNPIDVTKYNVDSINVITVTDSATFYTSSLKSNNDPNLPTWVLEKGDQNIDGKFGRDIIKFRFEFLNNDNPILGGFINTDVLAFRAYINEFSDGMNAKWDSYRYMGRGEDFYVYNGFTRDITLGFTIYAHSPQEMAPIYKKLNYLLSTFTPDYSAANKMRGNIGYLTVGDYLYRQPGVFTDIKLSGLLETHWEIALDSPEGGGGKDQYEVPKHINVNMSFKPIHSFLPRKAKYKDGKSQNNTPFITVDKVAYPGQASKKGDINSANKYLD